MKGANVLSENLPPKEHLYLKKIKTHNICAFLSLNFLESEGFGKAGAKGEIFQ